MFLGELEDMVSKKHPIARRDQSSLSFVDADKIFLLKARNKNNFLY